jgi:hypothetical protein
MTQSKFRSTTCRELAASLYNESIEIVGPDQVTHRFDGILQYFTFIATFANGVAPKFSTSSCVARYSLMEKLSVLHGYVSTG